MSCNSAISPGCLQQAWCIVPLSVCRESIKLFCNAKASQRSATYMRSRHAETHQLVCLVPHETEGKVHVQVYATSMAMLVTTVVSVLFFGLQPSLQLLLGIVTRQHLSGTVLCQPQSAPGDREGAEAAKMMSFAVASVSKGTGAAVSAGLCFVIKGTLCVLLAIPRKQEA